MVLYSITSTQFLYLLINREEQQLYKKVVMATIRRKGVQLFQYKYYKDQLPLSLSPEEMEQVRSQK